MLSMERGICRPVGLSMVGHEIDLVPERMQALLFLEVVDSDGELLENCVDIRPMGNAGSPLFIVQLKEDRVPSKSPRRLGTTTVCRKASTVDDVPDTTTVAGLMPVIGVLASFQSISQLIFHLWIFFIAAYPASSQAARRTSVVPKSSSLVSRNSFK